MKKKDMTSLTFRRFPLFMAAALMIGCLSLAPSKAYAQCENPFNATNQFNSMARDIVKELNKFIQQEENFIDEKLTHEATYEMELRLYEFDTNIRKALTDWWNNRFLPDLKKMSKQVSAAQVDQSQTLGKLVDAENIDETLHDYNRRQAEAVHRYQPSEIGCTLDSQGVGTGKAYRLARAYTSAATRENTDTRMQKVGSPGAAGPGAMQAWQWQEYVTNYCDPAANDQGCTTAGALPGKNRDLPDLLWGQHMTMDMSKPENKKIYDAVMSYFVSPPKMTPIPASIINTEVGRQEMMARRADNARLNTIYNVIAQMMSERVGGSQVNTQDLRVQAGLPPGDAETDASYREIQQAMTKDRFRASGYTSQLVNDPASLLRTEGAINAIKMEQMNDIYHRLEERVFMEAATYSKELDDVRPHTAHHSTSVH
ncbi:MAG: hypothetical protein GC185_04380 [Alphaproteobacteria bacterium]|nr:hypothetical protein [Alphaproteobacteria bacterium]